MSSSPFLRSRIRLLLILLGFLTFVALVTSWPSSQRAKTPSSHALHNVSAVSSLPDKGVIRPEATISVNSLSDAANSTDGLCTLREAITAANSNTASSAVAGECVAGDSSGTDTINLSGVAGIITLSTSLPTINSDMSFNGPGASTLTIQRSSAGGTPNFRVLTVNGSRSVTITGLTIANGSVVGAGAQNWGGNIYNDFGATMVINNCVIKDAPNGGGIANFSGSLTINNTTISGNGGVSGVSASAAINSTVPQNIASAPATVILNNSSISANNGTGIANQASVAPSTSPARVILNNSIVSGNQVSSGNGAGIENSAASGGIATVTLNNSTVSGNINGNGTAGIFNFGIFGNSNTTATITLNNSTVTGNAATGSVNTAGGIFSALNGCSGCVVTVKMKNTIVAGNTLASNPSDIAGAADSTSSHNLIGTGGNGGLTNGVNNNQVGVANPGLSPLADNGGPTRTHALLLSSPALDAGSNAFVSSPDFNGPPFTDQRGTGFARLADANGDGTATVDIGAYEVQSILVTNLNDSGVGSLRQAVTDANANAGTDAINFQAGLTGTISLATALPQLSSSIAINGPGANVITVQRSSAGGTPNFNVFAISSSVVKISGLTLSNGNQGAIVNNQGTLTINNCVVTGNSGSSAAIVNRGATLTINNSTISNNTTGGIDSQNLFIPCCNPAVATINNSTISGNTSSGAFAGIRNLVAVSSTSTMTVNNSTISGNIANSSNGVGGVLDFATIGGTATLVVNNSTIYGNTGNDSGGRGGVAQSKDCSTGCVASVKLTNTIVAGNLMSGASASDISGTMESASSFNLIGTGGSGGLTNGVNNNQVGVASPGLGALANNGGPTQTHALLTGSPALDAGTNSIITNPPFSGTLFTDQRGTSFGRIIDGPDPDTTATVDIGAYETQAQLASLPDVTSNEDTQTGGTFDVGDASTVASISLVSSNSSLVPNDSAHLSSSLLGSTGIVTINPAANAIGNTNITITVNRNVGGPDVKAFMLTVNPINDAPTITKGPNQIVNEDVGAQTVNNWATNISPGPADESGQTLSLQVTGNTNPGLFAVAPAVSLGGTLTYTPLANVNGSATITLALQDNGGTTNGGVDTTTETFTISVNAVNDPPSFSKGANQNLNEDAGPQTITNWATNMSAGPSDESAQTVSFQISSNTNPALFAAGPAVSPSGTLTYTPAADANGSATIGVAIVDNGGTANGGVDTSAPQTFTITVNPVNDVPSFTKGADQTVNEDAGAQTVANWATGISAGPANESGQVLTFQVTNNTNASLFSSAPVISSAGTLSYTPAINANGSATVTINLRDNGGTANGGGDTSASQTFTITVNSVNDAPSFTKGANQTVNEDAGAQSVASWATSISPGPNEAGQTLSFTVTNDNNALFSVQPAISSTGTLSYTPAANANGTATVTVSLKDNGGTSNGGVDTSAPATFTINVNSVNDVPSFTKGDNQTVNEDAGAQTVNNWATAISPGPADESGQILTFQVTGNTNAGLFSSGPAISSAGTLNYTPAASANGTATITINLRDDGGTANGGVDTSASQMFTITVNAVNDAPSFTKGPDQFVNNNTGAQTVDNWATNISPGPANESGQTVTFQVTNNTNPGLFSVAPAISSTGTLTYTPVANANGLATITIVLNDNGGTANGGVDTSPAQTFNITVNSTAGSVSFGSSTYGTTESSGSTTITVKRTGDVSRATMVDYTTSGDTGVPCSTPGAASPKCDFTSALGTLKFAIGEDTKTFTVLISQDSFVEGPEPFTLTLSNPTGGGAVLATPSTATVTIADDVTEPSTNVIDDASNFVRQHYHDFLYREPDAAGLAFWVNQITSCGADAQCIEVRRIHVSASFFLSIEFQDTGYLVERIYKVSYGDGVGNSTIGGAHTLPVPIVKLNEFLPDTQELSKGVIVGQPGWELVLENNKQAFVAEFVQRTRFATQHPTAMTPTDFVSRLFINANVLPTFAERQAAIDEFGGAGNTTDLAARGRALRKVAEHPTLATNEINRAFVLMQYFGFLRRNPNDPQDTDHSGYDFWLTKLNQFNGDFIKAEMVKGFLSSIEYRQRFGQ